MQKKTKKNKSTYKPPTEEEFLQYVPFRGDFSWHEDQEGLVHIRVPKFDGGIGLFFCKLLKKDRFFTADFDPIGSFIWKASDGTNTVSDILDLLKETYPQEAEKEGKSALNQRLFLFLQQMANLRYILITEKKRSATDEEI